MRKISWAHLCDYASLSMDQKVTMAGLFGRIVVFQLPVHHQSSYLAFSLEVDSPEAGRQLNLAVEMRDPDGAGPTWVMQATVKAPERIAVGELAEMPQVLRLPPLALERPGKHAFWIKVDGNTLFQLPVDVVEASTLPGHT